MPEEKKAKIGFIGCGSHATGSLYPMIHLIPEIDLVAVCDLKGELAKRNARNFGARNWYANLDKMLSQEEMDGAIICGLPKMHCEVGKKCLDKGLPIFVEKPSAISYKEALDLAEYAKKKNLFGAVAFMKRSSTGYRMAKSITEKKEFGKINEIEVRFANGRYPDLNKLGWGLPLESPAYSFLIGQAVHIFDLIRFFCGEVEEIYARLNEVEKINNSGIFGYAITVAFKDEAVGIMNLNALQGPDFQMSEYFLAAGSECWLEVKDMISLNYYAHIKPMPEFNPDGRAQVFSWKPEFTEFLGSRAEGMMGYKGEMQNFARKILGKEELRADLFDGAKDLQIAEAVWESSQSKKAVKI
ncbi:MAG: scyllo-inositol 2-dehydrogenase (NAD(+)) [candidate division WS2 bacterium]|nr:scyllo-inositol 2-dehydrogenase (NAD(+)) [Candidatus Psychracetigena formicireducens]